MRLLECLRLPLAETVLVLAVMYLAVVAEAAFVLPTPHDFYDETHAELSASGRPAKPFTQPDQHPPTKRLTMDR